jgi:hypothetical protein
MRCDVRWDGVTSARVGWLQERPSDVWSRVQHTQAAGLLTGQLVRHLLGSLTRKVPVMQLALWGGMRCCKYVHVVVVAVMSHLHDEGLPWFVYGCKCCRASHGSLNRPMWHTIWYLKAADLCCVCQPPTVMLLVRSMRGVSGAQGVCNTVKGMAHHRPSDVLIWHSCSFAGSDLHKPPSGTAGHWGCLQGLSCSCDNQLIVIHGAQEFHL